MTYHMLSLIMTICFQSHTVVAMLPLLVSVKCSDFFYDVIAVIASNSCRAVMAISDNCKIILLRHWPLTRVWHLPFTCLLHCFVSWPRVIGYCHQMNLGLNGQCLLYVVSKAACLLRISSSLCANVPYHSVVWFRLYKVCSREAA